MIFTKTDSPLISICIPAYEMGGVGARFLDEALAGVAAQTLKNCEVVVADQSEDDSVSLICAKWGSCIDINRLDTKHLARKSSANCNEAMRASRGKIIKILFQDDLLHGADSLADIAKAFESVSTSWLLSGSGQTCDGKSVDRTMVPAMHPQIRFGKNTVSSPSVLAILRELGFMFDEELVWLMDVEFYHRISIHQGPPVILPQTLVLNREHPGQVSATICPNVRKSELEYVRSKFPRPDSLQDKIAYYKQRAKAR